MTVHILIKLLFFLTLLSMWYFLFGHDHFLHFKKHNRLIKKGDKESRNIISIDSEVEVNNNKEENMIPVNQNIPIEYAEVIDLMKSILEMDEAFLSYIKSDANNQSSLNEFKNMLFLRQKTIQDLTKKYSAKFNIANEESQKFSHLLHLKFPQLNERDLRLCYYFRFNLSSREISNLEGLTDGSVRVYKTKIKTKLRVPTSHSLSTYLKSLEFSE